jgi:hypothetical protein
METQARTFQLESRRLSVPAEDLRSHVSQVRARVTPFLARVAVPDGATPAVVVIAGENMLQCRHVFDTVMQVSAPAVRGSTCICSRQTPAAVDRDAPPCPAVRVRAHSFDIPWRGTRRSPQSCWQFAVALKAWSC